MRILRLKHQAETGDGVYTHAEEAVYNAIELSNVYGSSVYSGG